jgi:hypothetical protein
MRLDHRVGGVKPCGVIAAETPQEAQVLAQPWKSGLLGPRRLPIMDVGFSPGNAG